MGNNCKVAPVKAVYPVPIFYEYRRSVCFAAGGRPSCERVRKTAHDCPPIVAKPRRNINSIGVPGVFVSSFSNSPVVWVGGVFLGSVCASRLWSWSKRGSAPPGQRFYIHGGLPVELPGSPHKYL